VVDAKGLITDERAALSDVVRPFARTTGGGSGDVDREALLEVVRRVRFSSGLRPAQSIEPRSQDLGLMQTAMRFRRPGVNMQLPSDISCGSSTVACTAQQSFS